MEQAAYEMGFGSSEDFLEFKRNQRVPEGEPPYVTHQKELVEKSKTVRKARFKTLSLRLQRKCSNGLTVPTREHERPRPKL